MELVLIFLSASLVNNFVLSCFLGICPFLGVSGKIESAVSMGFAVTFVMTLTAGITWFINRYILIALGVPFLEYVSFIIVIASLVQFVEMLIRKISKPLYDSLCIYLPLITTNCAILGLALFGFLREYSFIENMVFGTGAGIGFTLALVIMAGIREELELADVPHVLRGPAISLIIAGLLALAFMGFAGLISA
ncbi:MAG: electron transport complex subunit RsxA [Spirochaetes bacterium]|nr:MAG: electron transport complex subunit RsxA [Spirochaetota bacterium]